MPNAYAERQLGEQPATGLFAELGWQTVSARCRRSSSYRRCRWW
jgi:hypothetical protein